MKKNIFNILVVLILVSSINLKKMRLREDWDAQVNELLGAGLSAGAILDPSGNVYSAKNINFSG